MASKIRLNDEVIVIAGKDKKKTGKVVKVLTAEHKVVVEGVNLVKTHQAYPSLWYRRWYCY